MERVASTFGTGGLPSSEAKQLTHNHFYGACLVTMQRNDTGQVLFSPQGIYTYSSCWHASTGTAIQTALIIFCSRLRLSGSAAATSQIVLSQESLKQASKVTFVHGEFIVRPIAALLL